ncbi:hypothetical protein [Pseudomonas ovata]|uniref:hypothetical protein n=1 Tax=Pseudomonas ovata TaxID=1839709 RepID=UPI000D687947|nr:hypothetical protein [Pseudomonas ovata]
MANTHQTSAGNTARKEGSLIRDPLDPLYAETAASGDRLASSPAPADSDTQSLAGYIDELAERIAHLADNLRNQNADQALQQAVKMAQDNPTLFMLGSVALGFALSRTFRTDSPQAGPGAATESSDLAMPSTPAQETAGMAYNSVPPGPASTADLSDPGVPTTGPVPDLPASSRKGV